MRLRPYWRFIVVIRHFLPLLLAYARDRRRFILFGRRRPVDADTHRQRAEWLLNTLLALGPTFIKLGQLLSTRPDVMPPAYIEVLSQLQDEVPPASWAETKTVIEDDLGPVEEVFDEFDTDPISGASLGQVYRAQLDGDDVAVKVRRPGIESLVAADLQVIQWTLPVLYVFLEESRVFSIQNLTDEFEKTIIEEMDYDRERAMMATIRENFRDEQDIVIPSAKDEHSTDRVLVMDFLEGTKITHIEELDRQGIDRSAVATELERAYLKMVIEDGVFHADPHPGNLAVTDDGRVIIYDFGMSATVDSFLQQKITEFYIAVANQDVDAILDVLTEAGTLSPAADRAVMAEVLELAIQDARGEEIERYRVNRIVQKVEDSLYEFPFRLPKNLALLLRVATVAEGVCVTLDPDFDFIAVASEFLTERGYREDTVRSYVTETRDQLTESGLAALRTPPKLESFLDRADRENLHVRADIEDSDNLLDILAARIILGMLTAGGGIAGTLAYTFGEVELGVILGVLTLVLLGSLYRSFTKQRGTRVRPQFTRQSMRKRSRDDLGSTENAVPVSFDEED